MAGGVGSPRRVMGEYGYHVARVLAVHGALGLSFPVDLVKVAYFEHRDGRERMERAPERARIEAGYADATAQSAWVLGSVLP